MTDPVKVVCRNCGWRGLSTEQLFAENPFDSTDTIVGCPKCRCVNTTRNACDERGCWDEDTCGTPTGEGYRRTCHVHMPKQV